MALTKIPANMLSGVDLGNSVRVNLGSSNNLALFHTGGNGVIHNTTGELRIRANTLKLQDYSNEDLMIVANSNGSVDLYHNNQKKLETTSTGASVTGNLAVSGNLTVSGTTTELDTTNLNVTDKNITLNYHASNDTSSNADGAGITIQDAVNGSTDATLNWSASNDRFVMSHGLEVTSGIVQVAQWLTHNSTNAAQAFGATGAFGSSPAIGRAGDVNYHIAGSAAGDMCIAAEGSKRMLFGTSASGNPTLRMLIDSAGKVGIGTHSPGKDLHLLSSSINRPMIKIESTGANSYPGFQIVNDSQTWEVSTHGGHSDALTFYNGSAHTFALKPNGNVGIGTTDPTSFLSNATALEISGGTGVGSELILTNNSSMSANEVVGSLIFKNTDASGSPNHFAGLRAKAEATYGRMYLEFYAGRSRMEGNTPDMVISPGGADAQAKVGIGANNPGSLLELRTDTASGSYGVYPALSIRNDNAAGYGAIHFNEGGTQRARVEVGNNSGTPYMGLYTTGGNSGITIKDGKVGIGQTAPATTLHIGDGASHYVRIENAGSGDVSSGYQIYRGSSVGMSLYDNPQDNTTSLLCAGSLNINAGGSGADLHVNTGGNVGIGDSSPGHKLEVKSTENYKAIHIKGTNAPCYTMARGDGTNAEWRMGLSGYDYNDFAISSGTGTNDRLRIDPDGNMILGSANNVTPRDMHNVSATVSVSGPIASGYTMGTYSTGPMNVRDWFVYAGPTGGQSRYVHMKTDLWAGGSPNGNVEYTMSVFRYHSAYSYGNAKVSEGMIGWHNWSGSTAHQRIIHNPVSNWAIVKESYTSSDGYVVLVADILASGSYTQFSIDWFQWAGYPFRERKVTAVTLNTNATGAY